MYVVSSIMLFMVMSTVVITDILNIYSVSTVPMVGGLECISHATLNFVN